MPTVLGELRRYFRDSTWAVHVTRRTKELYLEAGATAESLTQRLGRPPAMTELAAVLGVPVDTVLHALNAGNGYRTAPIVQDSNEDGSSWDSVALAGEDDHLLGATDRVALRQHLRALPERERRILTLRFFEDRTQAEIAEELRLSQVHISRLLRSTLQELRRAYEEPATARS
jgi:RNA polymerase sigma-B factor